MTKAEFLELYAREGNQGDKQWRFVQLPEHLCQQLLDEGFSIETLLLAKQLPLSILKTLAKNKNPRIRCMVADKRAAGPILDELARDEDISVRIRVCYNAKVSPQILEQLAHDEAPEVRAAATRSRSTDHG